MPLNERMLPLGKTKTVRTGDWIYTLEVVGWNDKLRCNVWQENVFPTLISKAVETDDDVFLRWNGATIRVEPTDTIDTLMQKYDKEIRLVGLVNKMEMPVDGRDKHLYRIKNRLAEFYIVAHSFDEAADEMKKRLDKADYGFDSYRTVPSIDDVAVQHFYNEKQSFSDSNANLIIVED